MSTERRMDQEVVLLIKKKLCYIYTMEYYSAIKRNAFEVSSNEVDEPRTYYTQ